MAFGASVSSSLQAANYGAVNNNIDIDIDIDMVPECQILQNETEPKCQEKLLTDL